MGPTTTGAECNHALNNAELNLFFVDCNKKKNYINETLINSTLFINLTTKNKKQKR